LRFAVGVSHAEWPRLHAAHGTWTHAGKTGGKKLSGQRQQALALDGEEHTARHLEKQLQHGHRPSRGHQRGGLVLC
jgi:hypothetical protein